MEHRRSLAVPVLLLLLAAALTDASSATGQTCQSLECLTLASDLTSMMNLSADPCSDFHSYACGGFPQTVRYNHAKAHAGGGFGEMLFEDSLSIMGEMLERNLFEMLILDRSVTSDDSSMNQLYSFARKFFRSCGQWMQQSQVGNDSYNTALSVKFFQDVYDHLMLSIEPSLRPNGQFESVLATLTKAGGKSMLPMSLTRGLAQELLVDGRSATEKARALIKVKNKYYFCKPDFSPFVSFFGDNGIGESLALEGQTEALGAIQAMLCRYSYAKDTFKERNCTVKDSQREFTLSELDSLSRCIQPENPFSWSLYLEKLLHTPVDSETKLRVYFVREVITVVNYFKELPLYTANQTKFNGRVSYLIFDWLLGFADLFPRQLRQEWKRIGIDSNVMERLTGDITGGCMKWTKQFLQPIVERLYQRTYHPNSFDDVKNIAKLVKRASISSMKSQPWISSTAKDAIASKIQSMQQSIGFKELSGEQMTLFYNSTLRALELTNLTGDLQDNFGSLFALALCADARKNFEIIARDSPVSVFLALNPLVVNAFNFQQRNQIIFPMAILAPRVYHSSYPDYIKLGSLGYIIGHEIGHGFDNTGHEINRTGASGHFWDSKTEEGFLQRMTCVKKAYGNFTLYPGGPKHLSDWSVGNDIADILGIRAAYGAMQLMRKGSWGGTWTKLPNMPSNFTTEHLFFIQSAQDWCYKAERSSLVEKFGTSPSHSPHAIRVNGMAQNTKEFADAFKCPLGKPMNPVERCSFW